MHLTITKFVLLVFGSALFAALGIARYAFLRGEDPSDDGPRALVAEFLGYWAGTFFLLWSFFVPNKSLQWTLRGIATVLALTGIAFSVHFGSTTEVPETPDKEPTGFKNNSTDLRLE